MTVANALVANGSSCGVTAVYDHSDHNGLEAVFELCCASLQLLSNYDGLLLAMVVQHSAAAAMETVLLVALRLVSSCDGWLLMTGLLPVASAMGTVLLVDLAAVV